MAQNANQKGSIKIPYFEAVRMVTSPCGTVVHARNANDGNVLSDARRAADGSNERPIETKPMEAFASSET